MLFYSIRQARFFSSCTASVFACALLLHAGTIFSQSLHNLQNLKFQTIANAGGLANNRINNIIKDRDGFIWFGTENGVARFDGSEVKAYFYDQNDSTSLDGSYVMSFLLDNNNSLWIGTDQGLAVYNKNCDNFTRIKAEVPNENYHNILKLELLEDNTIIALSTSRVLYYDPVSASLKQYIALHDLKEIDPSDAFSQMMTNPLSGDLWIITANKIVIAEYPSRKLRIISHPCGLIRNIFLHNENELWIASQTGLFKMDLKSEKISRFLPAEEQFQGYFKQELWDVLIDDHDNLWIATDQNGLICYNTSLLKCIRYTHKDYDSQSLNIDLIRKVFFDNTGILWVGTQYKGINYTLLKNPKEFTVYMHKPDQASSISSNMVTAIMKDKNGNLWIGLDGGGINIIENASGRISRLLYDPRNPESISTNAVLAIFQDSHDNIWIGGYNGEICRYNPQSNEWKRFRNICKHTGCTGIHDVRYFMEDSRHRIWIGTNGHGLFMYNYDRDDFQYYTALNNQLVNDHILCIYEAEDHNLWIGTYNGLSMLNPDKKQKRFFNYSENSPTGISNNWIYCIHQDRKGRLWFGTAYGLNRYNPDNSTFTRFSMTDGLPGNVINGVLEDKAGNLWISTNYGISKFNPDSVTFHNLFQEDGLPGNEFIHGAFYKSRDGELFFGSTFGMVSFYPSKINPDMNVSPVVIRDVLVFFRSIGKEHWCDINQQKSGRKKIVLSYKQSTVTFNYTSLNYINPHNNKFTYILEGFENKWNDVGNRREATYINLNPGDYVFRVRGCNSDGICDEQGDSMILEIRPPWWKTAYFRYSLVIFLALFILALYYGRVKTVMKQKEKLESLVNQRTLELQGKNKELDELNKMNERILTIIAHDLKSPFNAIMGFVELLAKKFTDPGDDTRMKYIGYIQVSLKKILVLMENLLLWSSNQLKGSAFKPMEYSINEQIRKNIDLAHDTAQQKDISIQFSVDREYKIRADYNMIDTVIRNLLTNAIKFSFPQGEITLNLMADNGQVICSVSDSGMGMTEEEMQHLFNLDSKKLKTGTSGEQGSGLGLVICHDFILRNRGKIWVQSKQDEGSTFNFSVPAASN